MKLSKRRDKKIETTCAKALDIVETTSKQDKVIDKALDRLTIQIVFFRIRAFSAGKKLQTYQASVKT